MFKKISFGATVAGVHGVTKKHGTGQEGGFVRGCRRCGSRGHREAPSTIRTRILKARPWGGTVRGAR